MLDIVGEAALRVVLLTALVQCIVWVLRLRSARLLLSAWTVVLVASIAMPMLPHISPVRLPIDSAVSGAVADSVVELLQQSTLDRWATLPDDTVTRHDAPPPFRSWLSAIYVIVGGGILLRTMLGVGLSLRLLARASRVHPMWAAGHRVKISTDVTGPVTIAQVIVLPVDAMEWSAEMQQAVLAHEQAHVARVDFAMLVVSQLNRALFWFNPLSWWLHRRLVTLSELASDDQAIATIKDRFRYAEILLEMGRRSSATPRGPAMARPSTLAYRIERIVQGRTKLSRISRPWQILLTAGVAGLSLAVSSLASSFTSNPVTTPASMELTEALEGLHTSNWGTGATDEPGERDGSLPVGHVPIDLSAERSPIPSAPTAKTFTQISASTKPLAGLDRRRVKAVVALSPTQAIGRRKPTTTDQIEPSNGLNTKSFGKVKNAPDTTVDVDDPAIATAANGRHGSPLPDRVAHEPQLLSSNLEGIVGSTCMGVITVGPRAWRSYGRQPDVAAGELVPARAQFFRRADGTAWVRFDAFGQPPLDLPARFGRNNVTWIGQYGISYALQASGGNHVMGLAALIANDSAGLSFACSKSADRLL